MVTPSLYYIDFISEALLLLGSYSLLSIGETFFAGSAYWQPFRHFLFILEMVGGAIFSGWGSCRWLWHVMVFMNRRRCDFPLLPYMSTAGNGLKAGDRCDMLLSVSCLP